MLALTQLTAIMPQLRADQAVRFLPYLNDAMKEFLVDSPPRMAAFLAQLAHESAQLRHWEELPHLKAYDWCRLCKKSGPHVAGAQYEGRRDLGNDRPGDGALFVGRGPIQLTGRMNYRAAGLALGLPLEDHPEKAALPEVGFRVAGWFWTAHGLNALADAGDFDGITRRINGGLNGKPDRDRYHHIARNVLGVHPDSGAA